MKKSIIITLLTLAIITVVVTASVAWWFKACEGFYNSALVTCELAIEKGMPFSKIYEATNVSKNEPPFFKRYLVSVKKLPKKVKFGYYKADNLTLAEFFANVVQGKELELRLTIPEGANIFEIAKYVERTGLDSADNFISAAFDRDFIKRLTKASYESMEGFLFPGTYYFSKRYNSKMIIERLYAQFKLSLPSDFEEKVNALGLSFYDGLILASVIQKESYREDESYLVASVFYNRLKKRMRLQSDPTILYGNFLRGDFEISITRADLQDSSNIYNTYKINKLPPTPISNPSLIAIKATMNPAKTDYLFFVANKNGEHLFSKKYEEHRTYVNKYQRNGK